MYFYNEDYFRIYIGNPFIMKLKDGTILRDVITSALDTGELFGLDGVDYYPFDEKVDWVKLVLRPLDSITDEERKQYYSVAKKIKTWNMHGSLHEIYIDTPHSLLYLILNGIDAFGLIEKKLAINKYKV